MPTISFSHAGRPGLIEVDAQGEPFVLWSGMGFHASDVTGPLREAVCSALAGASSRATPHTVLDVTDLSIEQAEERGAYWLEDRSGFSRYWIGGEESAWACRDCGTFGGDPDDESGCPVCGFGATETDNDD
jgi:hypothetical protein